MVAAEILNSSYYRNPGPLRTVIGNLLRRAANFIAPTRGTRQERRRVASRNEARSETREVAAQVLTVSGGQAIVDNTLPPLEGNNGVTVLLVPDNINEPVVATLQLNPTPVAPASPRERPRQPQTAPVPPQAPTAVRNQPVTKRRSIDARTKIKRQLKKEADQKLNSIEDFYRYASGTLNRRQLSVLDQAVDLQSGRFQAGKDSVVSEVTREAAGNYPQREPYWRRSNIIPPYRELVDLDENKFLRAREFELSPLHTALQLGENNLEQREFAKFSHRELAYLLSIVSKYEALGERGLLRGYHQGANAMIFERADQIAKVARKKLNKIKKEYPERYARAVNHLQINIMEKNRTIREGSKSMQKSVIVPLVGRIMNTFAPPR